jgi:hypothetical protein
MPAPVLARFFASMPRCRPCRTVPRPAARLPDARDAVLVAILAASLLPPASPVRATTFCDVRRTSDGFVALRAGPDAKARLVARMRAGDEVLVRDDVASRGGFMFVTWWKGGRFKVKRDTGYDPSDGEGWVRETLIADECG